MRFLRLLVSALVVAGTALVAPFAEAAVAVTVGSPDWSDNRPDNGLTDGQINQADCLTADVSITFDIGITGADSDNLFQVWAGTTCESKESREQNADCVMVDEGDAETHDVTVAVRDLIQPSDPGRGKGTGTEADCMGSSEDVTHSLFFLVLNQSDATTPLGKGTWAFNYDLVPPDPPTDVVAGPGENSVTFDFTASEDDDLDRYRFYCSQEDSATMESCSSTVLMEGAATTGLKSCGSTSATAKTSGETNDDLTNGLNYAVAVAGVDKFGNVGVLSNISCAQPQEVTGYFEAYRAAGGQAGGGFCGFAPARRGAIPIMAALVFGLVAFARRRR